MKTEILVPLYFWPYEELSISNYNQTINFTGVGAVVWPGVSHFARFGASALFRGSFGIVWRSSWAGALADYGVGLTQV